MKKISSLLLFFWISFALIHAQPSTEVYIFDLGKDLKISNPINISKNPGVYDNQPSFHGVNTVFFSSTREGQTDIRSFNLKSNEYHWISSTIDGSEYSPLKIPNQNAVSSIRLDKDGKQLLYQYDINTGNWKVLVDDLVIGYHVWASPSKIISFVLGETSSLVLSDINSKVNTILAKNIGRSLHKIPKSSLISYVSKENEAWEIRSLDIASGATKFIANTIPKAEDMCWLPDGTIVMGKESILYKYNPKKDTGWEVMANLSDFNMTGISRITINADASKMAVVVSEPPLPFQNNTIQMGVVVSNLERSLDFYKNIIGMEEVNAFSVDETLGKKTGLSNGIPFHVKVLKLTDQPNANQFKLMSFDRENQKIPKHIQDRNGVQYITIFVNSVKPFIQRCKENNIKLLGETPVKLPDGKWFVLIQDPDGLFIELIGDE